MLQQIRQGDSLLAPFTTESSHTLQILEKDENPQIISPKKPLDFLLPFAIATNINSGRAVRENLRIITEDLCTERPLEKRMIVFTYSTF